MILADMDRIKGRLCKILDVTASIAQKIKCVFDKIIFVHEDINHNKDELEYWQGNIFSVIAIFFMVLGAPLFFYGAFLFYKSAAYIQSLIEIFIYLSIVAVITRKSLSIKIRKLYLIISVYMISIFLIIFTGVSGAGMVCVLFSLILAGCLLSKSQAFIFVSINLLVFAVLTILLMNGYFDGSLLEAFKAVWFINAITVQVCGIILLFLMNAIYEGLEKQTKLAKKSKESLLASEAKHKAMIANISDVIAIIDENYVYKYCSTNLEQKNSWKMDEFLNRPVWDSVYHEDREYLKKELYTIFQMDGMEKTLEVRFPRRNGEIRYVELTAANLTKDENIKGMLIKFHDITERKMREEKILYLNYHDSLTGLYNRTFFEKEKERFDMGGQLPLSIIIGDINGLKVINDALGHAEGDRLLVAISRILESCCSKSDIIARTGGDEFSMLLPGADCETACEIVNKINSVCDLYNKRISNEIYYTSISLGYATKTSIHESMDKVLKSAEDYMYRHKLLETRSLHSSIISSMKAVLFEKSQETEEHAQRLVKLSKAVGQTFGLTNQQFVELELLSALHDIGKIGVDDQILNKPGKLTDEEWVDMRKHSEIGYRIAMSSPELVSIADYILTHHERWDGCGYPQGLMGDEIPLLSRILAVVDAFDAMTQDRPYRKGMSKQHAISELIENAGTQFDPIIVEIFIEIVNDV